MIESMRECGPDLTPDDIERVESTMGVRLPREYKDFLLRYNGGRPAPKAFPIEGLTKNPFGVIHFFYGIGDAVESCNLDWNRETLSGRLPSNLLSIACDDGSDQICISLFGEDAGEIVFWDIHKERAEPSYENVFRVAGSFTEFIDGIRDLPNR